MRSYRSFDPERFEEWVDLSPYKLSNYDISSFGNIRYGPTGRSLRRQVNRNDTVYATVYHDFRGKSSIQIAKLVLWGFVGEDEDPSFTQPLHKDANRLNNRLTNLKWETRPFVIRYNKSFKTTMDNPKYHLTPITNLDNGEQYSNCIEAAIKTGVPPTDIYTLAVNPSLVDLDRDLPRFKKTFI